MVVYEYKYTVLSNEKTVNKIQYRNDRKNNRQECFMRSRLVFQKVIAMTQSVEAYGIVYDTIYISYVL